MLAIGIIVLGLIAFKSIPVELMPFIEIPEVTIITQFPGASAEDVEIQITSNLEKNLSTTPGLKTLKSTSMPSRSEIFMSFTTDISFMEILNQVKDRIDGASLPEGAFRPRIQRDLSREKPLVKAVIVVNDDKELESIDELAKVIEKTEGVALVTLMGESRWQISVELLIEKMLAYQITSDHIKQVITESQKSYSAGSIKIDGRVLNLRLGNEVKSIDELKNLIIKHENNKTVRLTDVAMISKNKKVPENRVSFMGKPSILIEVRKEATANAVVVGEKVMEVLTNTLKNKKITYEILNNQSLEISRAISEVKDAALSGGGLTAVMIYFLLQSFSATLIIIASIPLSLLICMIGMMLTGVSFNTMSLIGMALGIGMIVDSAIVVLDNINFYKARLDDPTEAALWGVKKVVGQVVTSTLCTMMVFAPLVFAPGTIGGIFKDVSLVVIYSLTASIVIALLIIPPLSIFLGRDKKTQAESIEKKDIPSPQYNRFKVLQNILIFIYRIQISFSNLKKTASVFLSKKIAPFTHLKNKIKNHTLPLITNKFEKSIYALEVKYEKSIVDKIPNAKRFIGFTFVLLFITTVLFLNLGSEFFPEEKSGNIISKLQFSASMPRSKIILELEEIESKIIAQNIGMPSTILGVDGENIANLVLTKIPLDYEYSNLKLQRILLDVPDLVFTIDKKSLVSQARPIQLEIYNDSLEELEKESLAVLNILKKVEEIKNPSTDLKQKVPELKITFDRVKLSKSQVEINEYINNLKNLLNNFDVGTLSDEGVLVPLRLLKKEDHFKDQAAIQYFGIWSKNKINYLNDVASLSLNQSLPMIRHNEKKRMMLVEADLNGVDLEKAAIKVKDALKNSPEVKSINWQIGGAEADRKEVQGKMLVLVLLSLLLIYVLMASQFENLTQPLIIMLAIPLCLIGTAIMLFLFHVNVSAIVFVGIIILAGSCVSTSIILIDSINQNLDAGMKIMDAILIASKNRMRAVILTAGTGVIGLLPLLFSTEEGAALQKTLAVTIIGGLTSSTILTMLIIPVIYYHLNNKDKNTKKEDVHNSIS